jgi:hypothetical protein
MRKAAAVLRTCPLPHDLSSAVLARRHVEQFAAEQHLNRTTHVLTIIASSAASGNLCAAP